ncbi:MAG: serine hydrolase [Clostridia bacterium]|nr:serine hydrolase [Clostridia bacterium]
MTPWTIVNTPEEAGISSRGLLNYLDAVAKAPEVEHHAIMVLRHGKLAATMNFAPYDNQTPHMLFSLSKSFTSAAAGFAVQEGLLRWDTKVLDILADKAPENPSDWLGQITLSHLLMMGSGLDPKSDEVGGEDWARAVLACECTHEPGTHFHYNSHGTYLVSCMVQRVTGMTVRDYLLPRLFEPLGIPEPVWDCCPAGINVGGWGLWLSCDSIARFGQCLLQKGQWEDRQILPLEWFEKATVKQIDNSGGTEQPDNEWAQGYGYQFWRTRGNRFRGDGAFGQICMVSPDLDMVVAITCGTNDMGREMQLLHEHLFPAAEMASGTAEEQAQLQRRLAELAHPWPEDDGSGLPLEGRYADEQLSLDISRDGELLRICLTDLKHPGETCQMDYGRGQPVRCAGFARPDEKENQMNDLGAYGWQNGVLHLALRTLVAPFALRAALTPVGDGLELDMVGIGYPTVKTVLKRQA